MSCVRRRDVCGQRVRRRGPPGSLQGGKSGRLSGPSLRQDGRCCGRATSVGVRTTTFGLTSSSVHRALSTATALRVLALVASHLPGVSRPPHRRVLTGVRPPDCAIRPDRRRSAVAVLGGRRRSHGDVYGDSRSSDGCPEFRRTSGQPPCPQASRYRARSSSGTRCARHIRVNCQIGNMRRCLWAAVIVPIGSGHIMVKLLASLGARTLCPETSPRPPDVDHSVGRGTTPAGHSCTDHRNGDWLLGHRVHPLSLSWLMERVTSCGFPMSAAWACWPFRDAVGQAMTVKCLRPRVLDGSVSWARRANRIRADPGESAGLEN
jgi:hypothetical protein